MSPPSPTAGNVVPGTGWLFNATSTSTPLTVALVGTPVGCLLPLQRWNAQDGSRLDIEFGCDRLSEVVEITVESGSGHGLTLDLMRLRPSEDGLEIPAYQSVTLAPGGYHLMFIELKAPIPRAPPVTIAACPVFVVLIRQTR